MRWVLGLIAACALGGCFMARQDARIRPGGQVGVTSVVMYTPDAETTNPDNVLTGLPPENDASDVRGLTEVTIAYGWKRAELRWQIPTVRWNATNDFLFDEANVGTMNPLFGDLDLYIQLVNRAPVFAGVGLESAGGGYAVVTGELGPSDAVSATVRAVYGGSETNHGPDPDDRQYSVQLQAQASYTHQLDAKHDLRLLISVIKFRGDMDPVPVHADDYSEPGQSSYVTAHALWMIGGSIDWH
jgi:hypothetical protein